MAQKGKVIFDKLLCGWQGDKFGPLMAVTNGKEYAAVLYGPDELDDLGREGCGCPYIVFTDNSNSRVGFGWSKADGVQPGGVLFEAEDI